MNFKAFAFAFMIILTSCVVYAQNKIILQTEDKWKLEALFESSEDGKYVILLHDLGRKKEDFASFEKSLAKAGFGYLAVDLRGHGQSTNLNIQTNFKKTGEDNEFNQMGKDVDAAIEYLNRKGVYNENIFLLGAGLGANVVAKSLPMHPKIGGVILLTPSLKSRDVLTMAGIRTFKGPVFIGVSVEDRKQFMEASFIRNAAFLASGQGKVTFITAYNLKGVEMLNRFFTDEVLQWLKTPQLPEVLPDNQGLYGGDNQGIPRMNMQDVLQSLD